MDSRFNLAFQKSFLTYKVDLSKVVARSLVFESDYTINRIYNKILDRDWFSARLFVT